MEIPLEIQGGSDLDTKSTLNLFGNQIDIKAPRGSSPAKESLLQGQNVNLQVEHGGIDLESVAGPLSTWNTRSLETSNRSFLSGRESETPIQ